jgi:hypothetical protein
MEAIFVLLIAPILIAATDSAVGFAAGVIFLAIGIFYRERTPCRIAAFLTSGFWLYIATRELGSKGFALEEFWSYVLPTVCALVLSLATQTCIFSKNEPDAKQSIPPKTQSHLRYIRQSLRVGIEHEIIIENLIERGVAPEEARILLQGQLIKK